MIRRLYLYESGGTDPYRNLAAERALLDALPPASLILYLWQNENTVVIGRNQNARRECRIQRLTEEGGRLARRPSGGGAVYHDLGNLNFTFLAAAEDFDERRQTRVVLEAVRALGVPAEASGRNDLTAAGRKFSGCAFFHHEGRSLHHGTLLVAADTDRMGRYLRPDDEKLRARGVASVRARVVNLSELSAAVTVPALREALIASAEALYGLPARRPERGFPDPAAVDGYEEGFRSWEWLYGRELPFDFACEGRYAWGGLRLELQTGGGVVRRAAVFTDAMDETLAPRLEAALTGCRFDPAELCGRAAALGLAESADVCRLIREQDL